MNRSPVKGSNKDRMGRIFLEMIPTIRFNRFLFMIIHHSQIITLRTSYVTQIYFTFFLFFFCEIHSDFSDFNG